MAFKQLNVEDPSNKEALDCIIANICKYCKKLHIKGEIC